MSLCAPFAGLLKGATTSASYGEEKDNGVTVNWGSLPGVIVDGFYLLSAISDRAPISD